MWWVVVVYAPTDTVHIGEEVRQVFKVLEGDGGGEGVGEEWVGGHGGGGAKGQTCELTRPKREGEDGVSKWIRLVRRDDIGTDVHRGRWAGRKGGREEG